MIEIGPKQFTQIIIKSDKSSWVLDEIKKEITQDLNPKFNFLNANFLNIIKNQCVFYINKYEILKNKNHSHQMGLAVYHLEKSRTKENKSIISILKNNHKLKCVQVTNNDIKKFLISKGVQKGKIFKIPIGINLIKFPFVNRKKREKIKDKRGLKNFLVIGSFQKDGIGWSDGNKPKKIKGPDIFLKIVNELSKKNKIHVVLTGPSRGYVKKKLSDLKISFEHHYLKNYYDIIKYYSMIDAYIVSSREEGGPRSLLESMASGVIIYSTKVGQAKEIIQNGKNGFLYDLSEVKKIAKMISKNYYDLKKSDRIIKQARKNAKNFSYKKTRRLWINFFNKLKKND